VVSGNNGFRRAEKESMCPKSKNKNKNSTYYTIEFNIIYAFIIIE